MKLSDMKNYVSKAIAESDERVLNGMSRTKIRPMALRVEGGYLICVCVDNAPDITVSSQREKERKFKTLSSVKKAIEFIGLKYFEVILVRGE